MQDEGGVFLQGLDDTHDLAFCMGMYEQMEDKTISGAGVWKKVGALVYLYFVEKFADGKPAFIIGSLPKDDEAAGEFVLVVGGVDGRPSSPVEVKDGQWLVPSAGNDLIPSTLSSRIGHSTKDELQEQMSADAEHVIKLAEKSRYIMVNGLDDDTDPDDKYEKKWCMGLYELVDGMHFNGHGVWKKAGVSEGIFLYFMQKEMSIFGKSPWAVGNMLTGNGELLSSSWMVMMGAGVGINIHTPDTVPCGDWLVALPKGGGFCLEPQITAKSCSIEDRNVFLQQVKSEEEQALAQAADPNSRVIDMTDLDHSERHREWIYARLMGYYRLMDGTVVNGRGVWQYWDAGGGSHEEMFLYYSTRHSWVLGANRSHMLAGRNEGMHLFAKSKALTPDQVEEATWMVCVEERDPVRDQFKHIDDPTNHWVSLERPAENVCAKHVCACYRPSERCRLCEHEEDPEELHRWNRRHEEKRANALRT
jgi:hypothetical protein